MTRVADVLKKKARQGVSSLPPEATVRDALQLMAEHDIGGVLVMEGGALKGIFTERDYARRIVLKGLHSADTPLTDVMTTRSYVVGPEQTVQECMGIMTEAHIRHLPVVEDGAVIGVLSIGDLVNDMLRQQRFLIEQLESYIAGG